MYVQRIGKRILTLKGIISSGKPLLYMNTSSYLYERPKAKGFDPWFFYLFR
jgi:hypothetical protein